jgi:hypothetical protein
MNTKIARQGLAVICAGLALSTAALAAEPLVLAAKGASACRIVLPAEATPAEHYAADELQRYLEAMSGAKLAIVAEAEAGDSPQIVLGATNARLAALGVKPDLGKLGTDGFLLRTVGNALVIAGGRPRGTLYGAYAVLEEELGVRWWTPEAEFVPKLERVTCPVLDEVQIPAFEYREVFWTELLNKNADFAARQRCNGAQTELTEKHGGRPVIYYPFCHSLDALIPRELYKGHPDYFPLVAGKRLDGYTQRCLSHPDVIKLAKANVRKWIAEHPEATIISVTQNDTEGWCCCDACRAVDEAEGSPAGSFLKFVNAIAADLEKDYPKIRIDTFAYQYTRRPPKTLRPHPNVIVRLCSIECCFAHPLDGCPSPEDRAFVADIVAWQRIAPKMYVWDYTTNFRNYQLPFPNLDALQPNVRFFASRGVTGLFEQGNYSPGGRGEMEPLRAYLLGKLLWNPETDVKRHTREFLLGYYGKAAPKLLAYLDLIHGQVREGKCHAHIFDKLPAPGSRLAEGAAALVGETYHMAVAHYLTPEILAEADRLLAEAETAVDADDPRFRVQVARLPVWYALLATKHVDEKERPALLDRFVATVRRAGITNLSEARPVDDQLKELGWTEPPAQ